MIKFIQKNDMRIFLGLVTLAIIIMLGTLAYNLEGVFPEVIITEEATSTVQVYVCDSCKG